MGTIYFEIPYENLTLDTIPLLNFNNCNTREIRELMRNSDYLEVLLRTKVSHGIQDTMNDQMSLDEDQLRILYSTYKDTPEDFNVVWMYNHRNLSIEFINEFLPLFKLRDIECQRNLTSEFVREHYKEMDCEGFVSRYMENKGFEFFIPLLDIPDITIHFNHISFNWKLSSSSIKELVARGLLKQKINLDSIDSIFDFRINSDTLNEMFKDPDAGYSSTAVLSYFHSNYPNTDVTWNEFVQLGNSKDNSTLQSIIFDNILSKKLLA